MSKYFQPLLCARTLRALSPAEGSPSGSSLPWAASPRPYPPPSPVIPNTEAFVWDWMWGLACHSLCGQISSGPSHSLPTATLTLWSWSWTLEITACKSYLLKRTEEGEREQGSLPLRWGKGCLGHTVEGAAEGVRTVLFCSPLDPGLFLARALLNPRRL